MARFGIEQVWVLQGEAGVGGTRGTLMSPAGALRPHMGVLKLPGKYNLSQPVHFSLSHSCLSPTASPGVVIFFASCLAVATSMGEKGFSTSKARASKVGEEEHSIQINSHLAAVASITGFHHEKSEQRTSVAFASRTSDVFSVCRSHQLISPEEEKVLIDGFPRLCD